MANCELHLVPLSCDRKGVGFTARPLSSESNKLYLQAGHARQFPPIEGQQYFYVKIQGCDGCCEVSKVVRIEGDILYLDRTVGGKCECITSNTMVSYDWDNIHVVTDVANSIGINVLSPLKYDTCTRTLSIDCKELFAKDCGGCGCNEGTGGTATASATTGGLRGERGEKGDPGVSVEQLQITPSGGLNYFLSDGTVRSAGQLPQAKGIPGRQGEAGPPGPKGDKGQDGAKLTSVLMKGTQAKFVFSDNNVVEADFSSLKGEQGDTGPQGPKGEKGEPGQSYQYIEVGNDAYIFGLPNTQVAMTSPALAGVTFGPFTTNAQGFVKIAKMQVSGPALVQMYVGNRMVGIGRAN